MSLLPKDALLLDNQLCFTLYAASRKVIQLYGPMLKELGLTYTQYITLLVLWEHPALSVKELGQYLMLDTGTLTPLLKNMESKGLLTRTRFKQDERVVMIEITPAGEALRADTLRLLPDLLCSTQLESEDMVDMRDRLKDLLIRIKSCEV